ncbi:MAG: FlgO family outer membrane protein [Smithellaceae bacterium]|jgi:TolB-like protein|nr:FlgO family outer membrane protein [Smithellaceae bacterium]
MNKKYYSFVILLILIVIYGCGHFSGNQKPDNTDLILISKKIVDGLEKNMINDISGDQIIVATFVNVDNLMESSTFGRIIAEQVSAEFANRGHKVVEVKLRNNSIFFNKGKGEFLLSRDVQEISKSHNTSCVVVGVYGDGYKGISITSKMIEPNTNIIISAISINVPMQLEEQKKYLNQKITIDDVERSLVN